MAQTPGLPPWPRVLPRVVGSFAQKPDVKGQERHEEPQLTGKRTPQRGPGDGAAQAPAGGQSRHTAPSSSQIQAWKRGEQACHHFC